jgi:hypothetical protein
MLPLLLEIRIKYWKKRLPKHIASKYIFFFLPLVTQQDYKGGSVILGSSTMPSRNPYFFHLVSQSSPKGLSSFARLKLPPHNIHSRP